MQVAPCRLLRFICNDNFIVDVISKWAAMKDCLRERVRVARERVVDELALNALIGA